MKTVFNFSKISMLRPIAFACIAAFGLSGCGGRESGLLYYYTDPQLDTMAGSTTLEAPKFSDLTMRGVDILWVIDNSGSMAGHQADVQ